MSFLNIIEDVVTEQKSIKNHPVAACEFEEKLHYLNALAILANADGEIHAREKNFIKALAGGFGFDNSVEITENACEIALSNNRDSIAEVFSALKGAEWKWTFMLDALVLVDKDDKKEEAEKKALEFFSQHFEITSEKFATLSQLYAFLVNKDAKSALKIIKDSSFFKTSQFTHTATVFNTDILAEEEKELKEIKELFNYQFKKVSVGGQSIKLATTCVTGQQAAFILNHMLDKGEIKVKSSEVFLNNDELFFSLTLAGGMEFKKSKFVFTPKNPYNCQCGYSDKAKNNLCYGHTFKFIEVFIEKINSILSTDYGLPLINKIKQDDNSSIHNDINSLGLAIDGSSNSGLYEIPIFIYQNQLCHIKTNSIGFGPSKVKTLHSETKFKLANLGK